MSPPSDNQPDAWGIAPGYRNADDQWVTTPAETRAAIRNAMDADSGEDPATASGAVRVVTEGETPRLEGSAELILEDDSRRAIRDRLPPDVPTGYHWIQHDGAEKRERLIVCPPGCYLPEDLWAWGWSVQLPSLRSHKSWGIGDLADLRELASWSGVTFQTGILLVNPLLAPTPVPPVEPSPYYPSSRCFLNPLYLRVEEVAGATESILSAWADEARALNHSSTIPHDQVFQLKMKALETLWQRFREAGGGRDYDRWRADQGAPLRQFASFCVLAERFGASWRNWPREFRRPDSAAVVRMGSDEAERIEFHEWLQWLLNLQLQRVGEVTRLIQDLPVGFAPDGADAWIWQDSLALEISVGAPPDAFNAHGQNWRLPPFVPHKLRAAAYEPFIRTLRASFRHGGGLRIDHVMGLSRLFWIPPEGDPQAGTYVHYPIDDLLRIVALESHRAQAVVVGEDLGTVEPSLRLQLRKYRIFSYGVLWFEPKPPAAWPVNALAAITTHDLPTIAGLWTGSDLQEQERLGLHPNHDEVCRMRQRLAESIAADDSTSLAEVIVRTHRLLAQAPSRLAVAGIEDALAMPSRPNIPGTSHERPNWSIPLAKSLESIRADPSVRAVGREMSRGPSASRK